MKIAAFARMSTCTPILLSVVAMAVPLSASAAMMSSQDSLFVQKATQAGRSEVQLAALAMQKSQDPRVRSFARRMTVDHSQANDQLASIVKAQGLIAPQSVGQSNAMLAQHLAALHGTAFSSMYLRTQLTAHHEAIALFEREIASGSDRRLVAFARKTLPTLEEHLAMDRRDVAH